MKLPSAFLLSPTFLLLTTTVKAQSPSMEFEATIKSQPMLSNFYKLMLNVPDQFTKLRMDIDLANTGTGNGVSMFAPINSSPNPPAMLNSLLVPRGDRKDQVRISYHLVENEKRPPPPTGPITSSRAKARRTTTSNDGLGSSMQRRHYVGKNETFDYPIGVRNTFLDDPEFDNLGPGLTQRLVARHANSTCEDQKDIEISTGGGDIVKTTGTPIRFKGGVIFPVDGLPYELSETLSDKGLTGFLEAIKRENLVHKLDDCPGITVFAPLNPSKDCNVKARVVFDFTAYSPDLVPGASFEAASGANLTISKGPDGSLCVNGEKIVKSDVLVKNGVVHFVDNVKL
ncbi:hypothetical protein K440DRAFT_637378 [Wilcoxina mikolae CBS 423.85]|nr:hypothetical protein K440DRAFT_637378 [Wilcoxina mikolae CBS 423.85]